VGIESCGLVDLHAAHGAAGGGAGLLALDGAVQHAPGGEQQLLAGVADVLLAFLGQNPVRQQVGQAGDLGQAAASGMPVMVALRVTRRLVSIMLLHRAAPGGQASGGANTATTPLTGFAGHARAGHWSEYRSSRAAGCAYSDCLTGGAGRASRVSDDPRSGGVRR